MKTLATYTEEAQTNLFKEYGVFFAFSNEQFKENKTPLGEAKKYIDFGMGMYMPKGKEDEFMQKMDELHKEGRKLDLEENGKEAIIKRELANHEAQITMSIEDTVEALDGYGFTREEIQEQYKIFFDECVEKDLF